MKRLWGIRHVRYLWYCYQVHRWAQLWHRHGIGLGWPNEADLRALDRIWDGKA